MTKELLIERIEGMRKKKHDDIPSVKIYGSFEDESALPLVDCSYTEAECYNAALDDVLKIVREEE